MDKKVANFVIEITILKLAIWLCCLWMFVAILIAVVPHIKIYDSAFGEKTRPEQSGDYGILVIFSTMVIPLVTVFIRKDWEKIAGGSFILLISMLTLIGTLVTWPNGSTVLTWTIPTLFLMTFGVLYILSGFGILKKIRTSQKHNNPNITINQNHNQSEFDEQY